MEICIQLRCAEKVHMKHIFCFALLHAARTTTPAPNTLHFVTLISSPTRFFKPQPFLPLVPFFSWLHYFPLVLCPCYSNLNHKYISYFTTLNTGVFCLDWIITSLPLSDTAICREMNTLFMFLLKVICLHLACC